MTHLEQSPEQRISEISEFPVVAGSTQALTPAGHPLVAPSAYLAALASQELHALTQQEAADPSQPRTPAQTTITQCLCTAIDKFGPINDARRIPWIDKLVRALDTDMLRYRDASCHPDLKQAQAELWDPLLDWFASLYGPLEICLTLAAHRPTELVQQRVRARLEGMNSFALVALHALHSLVPSVVAGLAVWHAAIDATRLCQVALLEEKFQIQQWGDDPEAQVRLQAIEKDMHQLVDYIQSGR